ncbi:glycerophosphodiester phosphodiesterase family protein [Fimbriiglobus ruber]|uniref:Glycerophosphoryl diester phosphodiesterase n=1 Tax=Fimbriiglobus ruber TaxID=1908690 RepID=A0A225DJ28_9BACT|nr:glycerophosphodiester phosphodiesterase family protein [Fimbriiglobus ruber]OWK38578.1 Glycerophosphoryl diester phosphodiesterase [Fimbriiglobus ruber]
MSKQTLLAVLLLTTAPPVYAQPNFPFFQPVQPPRDVQIMAHRGLHVLAPENTLPAIMACAADYIEWAEVDVRLTRDGRHVVIHDDSVDRCLNGKGRVSDLTSDELKQLDAGSWFADRFKDVRFLALAELLSSAKGKVNLYLDCKQVDPDLLAKEIVAAGMEKQVIVYAAPEVLAKISTAARNTVPVMTKYRPKSATLDSLVKQCHPAAVEIDADDVTPDVCQDAHARGIKVQAKVLGDKRDNATVWGKMLDAGADWLQTDDPVGLRFAEVRRRIPSFPVKISYHRGACRYAPENTLASIEKAAAWAADYIEIDIRPTADGKYMLLHDSTLDRTTGGRGPIRKATFDEVEKLSAGAWFGRPFASLRVPTLSDGLTAMGKQSHVYLDAKDITPADLLDAMRKHDLVERSVVYQSARYLERLKALEPKVRPLPPLGRVDQFDRVAAIAPYGFDANWSILSKELIERSHKAGIKVFSDSLSEKHENVDEYLRAMGWGIDVIQTNHPLRVLRAVELFKPTSP